MPKGNPNPSPETRFEEGHEAAVTHGIHSLEATGRVPTSLSTTALQQRETEIVQNLADLAGIEREMENTTKVGLLCLELGANWLYKELDQGKGFEDIALLSKLRTYISGTIRDLKALAELKESLGKDGSVIDAALEEAKRLQDVTN